MVTYTLLGLKERVPVCLVDRKIEDFDGDSVVGDSKEAAYELIRHLTERSWFSRNSL